MKCGPCNGNLGNIVNAYDDDMKALCKEFKVDNERVSSQPKGDSEFNRRKGEIMDKYVAKDKVCCRNKLMSHPKLINIVKKAS